MGGVGKRGQGGGEWETAAESSMELRWRGACGQACEEEHATGNSDRCTAFVCWELCFMYGARFITWQ